MDIKYLGVPEGVYELDVQTDGYAFHTIYGHYINGGFIALPEWKVGCKASSDPSAQKYNSEQLIAAGVDEDCAKAIAYAIYLKSIESDEVHDHSDFFIQFREQRNKAEEEHLKKRDWEQSKKERI